MDTGVRGGRSCRAVLGGRIAEVVWSMTRKALIIGVLVSGAIALLAFGWVIYEKLLGE